MGDYDVQIPDGTESGAYRIRVGKFSDDTLYGCSGVFDVVSDGFNAAVDDDMTSLSFFY